MAQWNVKTTKEVPFIWTSHRTHVIFDKSQTTNVVKPGNENQSYESICEQFFKRT